MACGVQILCISVSSRQLHINSQFSAKTNLNSINHTSLYTLLHHIPVTFSARSLNLTSTIKYLTRLTYIGNYCRLKSYVPTTNPNSVSKFATVIEVIEIFYITLFGYIVANLGNNLNLQTSLLPNSPQLRILHLEDSESITKALFRYDLQMFHLRSVEYLYLRKDNLQTLQSTFPQYLPNLRRISLTENPWNCNRFVPQSSVLCNYEGSL